MCGVVHAQSAAESSEIDTDDNTLDTIVVIDVSSGTGDVQHEEFTGSFQRIEREELQRRDITVADILAHEAGVQSRQTGGFGTFSSLTVRGASAAQTGVYLDGVLLNSGGNAVVDLSMLELLTVDSVDIYRGATPIQLGIGSMGGAVNLKTATTLDDGSSTVALLGIGSFSTQRAQLLHRARHARWDVIGALSFQQSKNDYPFLDSNGSPLNPNDDERQLRNNADVRRVSGMAKAGIQWSPQSRSDLMLLTTSRDLGVPEWRNATDNEADLISDNLRLQLNHTIDGIGGWNSRYNVYFHQDDAEFDDRLSQVGLGAQNVESKNETHGALTYWEHVSDARTISFSAEIRQESENANDLLDDTYNYRAERQTLNASAQNVGYYQGDRLLITTALSLQSHQDQYKRITRLNRSSRRATIFSPSVGARFQSSKSLSFRANLGRYYREPSFSELFVRRGLFRGSNDLNAERGINADLGLSWQVNKSVAIDSSLFASRRDELIATVYDARGIGRTINIGQASIIGLEFSANWRLTKSWSLRANATVQSAKGISDFKPFDGKQLPGEAQHAGYVRLQYSDKNFRAYVESDGAWNRFYDQANVLPAKDRWVQNIGVDWTRGRWTLNGALTNITDQNVEDFNGFPRPGQAFTLSLSTRL